MHVPHPAFDRCCWITSARAVDTTLRRQPLQKMTTFSPTVAASNSLEPIHILGLGNLGKLFAHSLAAYNPTTPITLLLHRHELVAEWKKAGQCIEVVTNGVSDKRSGFGIDLVLGPWGPEKSVIKYLLVATKTYATLAALTPLKHHLTEESTILFFQNGVGTSLFSWCMSCGGRLSVC
jgi:Ketopantoate reductase PanE/ApbA